MNLDYAKIKEAAQNYQKDMTKFLREIVKNPGESCDEKAHIERIAEEMRNLGFDKVEIDPMGNVLGFMGTGETLIGFDAHIDTVGSATVTTGPLTHTRAMRPRLRSAAAAFLISAAVSYPQYTALRS